MDIDRNNTLQIKAIEAVISTFKHYPGTMLMPPALPDGLALWVRLVTQIPIVIRIATTILVSYLLTLSIVGMLWNSTSTFRPVLIREVACWQENLLGSMASWKELAPG